MGWITTEEARELTGYSVRHLQRLARGGHVVAEKQYGGTWSIDQESLLAHQATARPGRRWPPKEDRANDG